MKKICLDMTENNCTSIFVAGESAKDIQLIQAGTTVNSMPVTDKNAEYQKIADDYDVHFLFDDSNVHIDFYTIPWIDIFATDSEGGYLGTVGDRSSLDSNAPICYIDKNNNSFLVADNFSTLMEKLSCWKEGINACDGIQFFSSKEDARRNYKFLDVDEFLKREI